MKNTFEQIKELIKTIETDIEKASSGNKSAITRVRKKAHETKGLLLLLRKESLEAKNNKENK